MVLSANGADRPEDSAELRDSALVVLRWTRERKNTATIGLATAHRLDLIGVISDAGLNKPSAWSFSFARRTQISLISRSVCVSIYLFL